jgi:nucleoside-diphosphate-sugar epimerase
MIARLTGYNGELRFDASKPDGQPRRCLDVTRARERLGFEAAVELEDGLRRTVAWYLDSRLRVSDRAGATANPQAAG